MNLAITDIDKNPFQTRYVDDDEALEELADSIKANGVVQPISEVKDGFHYPTVAEVLRVTITPGPMAVH